MIKRENTYFDFYKNERLKELLEYKTSYEKQLHALKSIKRETKKNGSDFQNFLKNFSSSDPDVKIQRGGLSGLRGAYITFWYKWERIDLENSTIREDFITEIEKKDPKRVIKESYLKPYVYYTPTEFFNTIQEAIEKMTEKLKKINTEINSFEEETDKLFEKMIPLLEFLKDNEKVSNYTLRQITRDTFKHYYW